MPGRSGNPRGRPTGSHTLRTELEQILKQQIAVRESGKRKRLTRRQALLLSLLERALRGDVRAATAVMTIALKLQPNGAEQAAPVDLSEDDHEIVADFLRRNQPSNSGV
jgi:hypothetical protein